MRIVLVIETLTIGGAETFVVRLANRLSAKHEVLLFVLLGYSADKRLVQKISPHVCIIYVKPAFFRIRQIIDGALRRLGVDYSLLNNTFISVLRKEVSKFKPHVIHSHLFKSDLLVARLKRSTLYPFRQISTIHGDYSAFSYGESNSYMLDLMQKMKFVTESVDEIVCLSREQMDYFSTYFSSEAETKLNMVYNGYAPDSEDYLRFSKGDLGISEDNFIIGMVSRGVEKKGWEKAIQAFLQAELPNSQLVLVGGGPYMEDLAKKYNHPGIYFAGFTANPLSFIRHFDLCLLPTLFHFETLPTVIIEYLFCCKPVIATDVGEIRSMLTAPDGGIAGFLLNFSDRDIQVVDIIDSIRILYYDKNLYNRIRSKAKRAYQKFNMESCVERYLELYNPVSNG